MGRGHLDPAAPGQSASRARGDGSIESSIVVNAGGKDDKGLFAYDAASGKPVWNAPAGPMAYSSPQLVTLDGQKLDFGRASGALILTF
jgi:outer membrane protein assembly factor BamB